MPNSRSLASNRVRRRPLFILTSLLFLGANATTVDGFVRTSKQSSLLRNCNGHSKTIQQTSSTNTMKRPFPKSLSRSKTSLSAFPLLQIASQAQSMAPALLLSMKDMGSSLASIITSNPDAEAEVLLDISHVFLDFAALFKFEDRFLNYAQLIGRISLIMIALIPGHAFHVEEMAIQLFFLYLNIQRIKGDEQETSTSSSSFSSSDISTDDIELQQQLHNRPLLTEARIEPIIDDEEEEITIESWEEIEFEMNEKKV